MSATSPATSDPPPVRSLSWIGRLPPESPPASSAGAAVLIVLRELGSGVETLLIERADRPGDPGSGQVGLPGGHVAASDGSLVDTALREAEEEVGVTAADLSDRPRYFTTEYASAFRLRVGVFAAALGPGARRPIARDPAEVAEVYWLPVGALNDVRPVLRKTRFGPRTVDAVVHDHHVLWGFTLRVLREFFGVASLPPAQSAGPR